MPGTIGQRVTRSGRTYFGKLYTTLMTLTTVTGTFTYGETVTGGTSSATGVVVYWNGTDSELQVAGVSGTFANSETITGGTSSATGTTSAAPAAGYPTTWTALQHITDQFQVNRQRADQEIIDSGSAETDFADHIAGVQSATGSWTLAMMPANVTWQLFEGAMDYNLDMEIKRVLVDRDAATTRTRYYGGTVNGFNESDPVQNESTVAINFLFTSVSLADPT